MTHLQRAPRRVRPKPCSQRLLYEGLHPPHERRPRRDDVACVRHEMPDSNILIFGESFEQSGIILREMLVRVNLSLNENLVGGRRLKRTGGVAIELEEGGYHAAVFRLERLAGIALGPTCNRLPQRTRVAPLACTTITCRTRQLHFPRP